MQSDTAFPPRVVVIAGSDSGGGAGVQADIKTITALGGYAATAITALTAQNTLGVSEIQPVDPFFVEKQLEVVLDDIGADAIKIGMLARRETAELVARRLESRARGIPIVLDPVLRSSSGRELLDPDGIRTLVERLLPQAALITPNAEEAGHIAGLNVTEKRTMEFAADEFLLRGAAAVLITGGDLEGDPVVDLLRTADGVQVWFETPRIASRATHGTGCTLASAIAVGLGEGLTLQAAVERARAFVAGAIRHGLPLGGGTGPVDHGWKMRESEVKEPDAP